MTEGVGMRIVGQVRVSNRTTYASLICLLTLSAGLSHWEKAVHASTSVPLKAESPSVPSAEMPQGHEPVLVELLTTGDCDTCQSAERTLAHLDRDQPIKGVDVIVLNERVKPQNPSAPSGYLSPTDPTRRQEDYQSLGTVSHPVPLFMVNGLVQDEHASGSQIEDAIRSATASSVPLRLTSVKIRGDDVIFALDGGPATDGYVNVYAAIVDPKFSSNMLGTQRVESMQTRPGIVQAFGRVGSSFRTKALGRGPFMLQNQSPSARKNLYGMRLVVFVQTKHIGPVLGSTSCVLRQNASPTGDAPSASFPDNPCPTEQREDTPQG
jgi:hypothetical protein